MNRRRLLAALGAIMATPLATSAAIQTAPVSAAAARPLATPLAALIYPPCPHWCEQDHSPAAPLAVDERKSGERFHSVCVGDAGPACVELVRTDNLRTGEPGPVGLSVIADSDLTAADAVALGELLRQGAAVMSGQLTVAAAREAAPGRLFHRQRGTA